MQQARALTLILVAVAGSTFSSPTATQTDLAAAIGRVVTASGGQAEIVTHVRTRAAHVLRTPAGSLAITGRSPAERAADALARYGEAFGIQGDSPGTRFLGARPERLGGTVVTFGQLVHGVPVFGAELRVRLDAEGELTAITGVFLPSLTVASDERRIGAAETAEIARAAVAQAHNLPLDSLTAADRGEAFYRPALIRPMVETRDWLVRQLEVRHGEALAELVLVSVSDGLVLERFPLIHDLERVVHLHELRNEIWREGDPLPFGGLGEADDAEVNEIIATTAATYQLFANLSGGGHLSWNGRDGLMQAVHDSTQLQCPNAQWTGNHTRFCRGTGSDDVIAHEWTHAYTQATHGLVYAYQQGALNEAYSDIFGELVDLLDDSDPLLPETPRTFDACSVFATSGGPRVTILGPPELAGDLAAGGADFNPLPSWSVEGLAELVDDGAATTSDGCEPLIGFTPGNIAVLDMGRCLFRTPVETAAAAGAVGAIIVNRLNDNTTQLPGEGERLAIPAVMVGKTDGARLKAALADGVTIRLSSVAESSARWLMGESAAAFGGAIRDMWAPECLGDPGSVTSPNYWCGEADNGGVHVNSAVANRAFALLADGGTTTAGDVRGIGLTRAAHIYWRAMSVYQSPLTSFADHADLLELACSDLIGASLTDLTTGAPSSDLISADDCAQLTRAISAVALRDRPLQCDFTPVLQAPAPPVRTELVLLDERFDADPGPTWERTWIGAGAAAERRDWAWTDDVPDGGDGGAFYAPDLPAVGGCNDRVAGSIGLTTPAIAVPDPDRTLVVFDHYLATSDQHDGGNLKLSVNGGPFELVPPAAFRFNPYNRALTPPPQNQNPIAGEPAWSGTNQGEFAGSWGQSQVDLASLVAPGDTIRIRFEFGNDVCVGGIGWYVDDVRIVASSPVRRGGSRISP